jgi:hypothetical protein
VDSGMRVPDQPDGDAAAMWQPARFVTRPVEPERITAIQFNGSNTAAVAEFVAKVGGRLIEWIRPACWVAFDDGRVGFPVPLMVWLTRVEGTRDLGMYTAEKFTARYQPTPPCTHRAAVACPVHGECCCTDATWRRDPGCPLHAPDSEHGDLLDDRYRGLAKFGGF